MANHVHILFKSGKDGISVVMRKLLTWYAQYFNRRHKRTGHLFVRRRGQKKEFDQRILGGSEFVNQILKETKERQLPQIKHKRSGNTIQKIIAGECRKSEINPLELQSGSKRRAVSGTRATIASRGRDELGLSAAAMARHVGVGTAAITKAIERIKKTG